MMATTHAFVGMALGTLLVPIAPDLAPAAVLGGGAGGILPDLDMVADHRRTLHFPAYYWIPTAGAGAVAVLAPTPVTVGATFLFLAAAVHSVSDVVGGGLELRPWRGESEKAVYLHPWGRWLRPRQWIRYDGAPEDFALGATFAAPSILLFEGTVRSLAVLGVAVSLAYALVRKRIPEWTPERFR
jgi:hypothetical protein